LIPAYVFFIIGMIIALASSDWFENFIPGFVLTSIGIPFVLVFLLNRKNWWALIPAYVLISIGTLITLEAEQYFPGDLFPALILWTISLPFFVTYLWNRRNWWALIPGGVLATIGAGLAAGSFSYLLPIILIGLGVLLLLRQLGGDAPREVVPATGPAADKPARK
jgi:hypothetical protein